ncbi:MAG TPA: pectate lyase [Opitutus sp.]|nr:pectate lyase [Opitutus sp.]
MTPPRPAALFAFALAVSIQAAPAPYGWPEQAFSPLTAERIAALPPEERPAWQDYWDRSETFLRQLPVRPKPDASPLKPMSTPPLGGAHSKGLRLKESPAWYAGADAAAVADRVVEAQTAAGGWTKGTDYSRPIPPSATEKTQPMFDNDATVSELRFLAQVLTASPRHAHARTWHEAFGRGMSYVFAAQYPNGGFPQIYPLVGGYHDGVTFNDDAMANVLALLRDVAAGARPFAFTAAPLRQEAARRFDRGIDCILSAQLRRDGERTVWCQQHDPLTLRPAAARNFEPIADCARESATLVLLLMELPQPSADAIAAVRGAVAWFRRTALSDLRIARAPADLRGHAVPSPGAPLLWARFYQPGTATPVFGDRDRTVHYDLSEISPERVAGYAWYTDLPNKALATFDRWNRKVAASVN